jgi:ABC-2 type transport system ATP-binding protein
MQEVEAICGRIIIIDKGIIVANEEKSKIYSFLKKPRQIVRVEFDKAPETAMLKEFEMKGSVNHVIDNVYLIETEADEDLRPLIFQFAVKNGLTVLSLQKQEGNLEDVFRHLTS